MYAAEVILDSVSEAAQSRLTTLKLTYPRFVHSEFMTHRMFSRNAASSRAIPFAKLLQQVKDDPVIPIRWGAEQKGMQQGAELDVTTSSRCRTDWLIARDRAMEMATALAAKGLHKSLCNRLLEPWMWITVICTATDWNNFFRQRCHPDAEPHLQKIAYMIRDVMNASEPRKLYTGEWHLPYITGYESESILQQELQEHLKETTGDAMGVPYGTTFAMAQISSARCARVSYLTHEGTRNWKRDLELFSKLQNGSGFGHWSPMEHPAQCANAHKPSQYYGNFRAWKQYRKFFQAHIENGDAEISC